MINETKRSENVYFKDLKEKFSWFDHLKSVYTGLNEIEETFRNPSLMFQTIKEMQRNQDKSLDDIQIMLN
jgi:hypothetical protein